MDLVWHLHNNDAPMTTFTAHVVCEKTSLLGLLAPDDQAALIAQGFKPNQ